jgi:hypothetical protein
VSYTVKSRAAWTSKDGRHRLSLDRWLSVQPELGRPLLPGLVTWVMLNPSTADAERDDPTLRRCMAFTASWSYERLRVVNVYSYRASDPALLPEREDDRNHESADEHRARAGHDASLVIAAWGTHAAPEAARSALFDLQVHAPTPLAPRLHCLGTTKDGHPRHPLYVPRATPLEPFALPDAP